MDGGLSAGARGIFRSIAFMIFMVSSAYLVLELVIALSAQGEPTGAVAPFSGAEAVYPNWYQAPEFLDAAWVALVAYPVAGIVYGIGMLAGWALGSGVPEQPRLPVQPLRPPDPGVSHPDDGLVPAVTAIDDLCVVGADRRIRHITLPTARLFGLTPLDMMGRSLEGFLSPADLPKLDALVAAAYADPPRAFATNGRNPSAGGVGRTRRYHLQGRRRRGYPGKQWHDRYHDPAVFPNAGGWTTSSRRCGTETKEGLLSVLEVRFLEINFIRPSHFIRSLSSVLIPEHPAYQHADDRCDDDPNGEQHNKEMKHL